MEEDTDSWDGQSLEIELQEMDEGALTRQLERISSELEINRIASERLKIQSDEYWKKDWFARAETKSLEGLMQVRNAQNILELKSSELKRTKLDLESRIMSIKHKEEEKLATRQMQSSYARELEGGASEQRLPQALSDERLQDNIEFFKNELAVIRKQTEKFYNAHMEKSKLGKAQFGANTFSFPSSDELLQVTIFSDQLRVQIFKFL